MHSNSTAAALTARQQEIMNLLRELGYVSIEMLANRFGVSQQTARREIIALHQQALVQRHHGGAGLPPGTDKLAYTNRKREHAVAKESIGKLIASKIPNGASLFIDMGTTMAAVAEALIQHENLKIITNHIDVVYILCDKQDFDIFLTGGHVHNRDRIVSDKFSIDFLRKFRVDYSIFGVGSLTTEGQLLDYHYRDAQISRIAMEISRYKFAGFDHSKFNASAFMPFAHVSEVDAIFTDQQPAPQISKLLKANGTELVCAGA